MVDKLLGSTTELPAEIQQLLDGQPRADLLEVLARSFLDRRLTDTLLVACEAYLPDSCARISGTPLDFLGFYARVLEFAPYLAETAFASLSSCRAQLAQHTQGNELEYLLAVLRLLHFDHDHFSNLVDLDLLDQLSVHGEGAVRSLAAQVLSLYLCAADRASTQIKDRWQNEGNDLGLWEGKEIHYRFLPLWEEKRHQEITVALRDRSAATSSAPPPTDSIEVNLPAAISLAGVILPRSSPPKSEEPSQTFVHTATADANLRKLAQALKTSLPLLMTGRAGSGKTTAIRHAAHTLNKLETMITLHINEQSDAKTLIGIYTTGSTPGSFVWQPGVLTKAVTEGRWVLIEDLERAPSEVMSVLLPLIERRELNIPGRNQILRASLGFRLLATTRTIEDHKGQEHDTSSRILGIRQWQKVLFCSPPAEELPSMISGSFAGLDEHVPLLVRVFTNLQALQKDAKRSTQSRTSSLRPLSQRELLNWASRVAGLVGHKTSITKDQEDQIFLSAVDCFAGFLPDGVVRDEYAASIAQDCGIDPQRRDHLLTDRTIPHQVEPDSVSIGLYKLPRRSLAGGASRNNTRFSVNRHTSRQLERLAAAVSQKEPLLLVGETGTGKTTLIQYLADMLGKRLVPFNLSQQSESGDMLGGFKPVSTRMIVIPLQEEFDYLFKASLTPKALIQNQDFLAGLDKAVAKQQWRKVCAYWRKAIETVNSRNAATQTTENVANSNGDVQPQKKRKLAQSLAEYMPRWERFSQSVNDIEARLKSGADNAVVFSFVEGNIVRAARHGDWVLLDEINLASPDTLEALADLFDKSPSIMLSEAGSTTAIKAHPEFRIFSAMNPATDVGKKDLPSGIRSRFTELYVESPDRDLVSLQQIVQKYLGINESVLSETASRLHQDILALADGGKLVDGAGQCPHFSLRTLTRVLLFARDIVHQGQCSLRRALHEGFCMSYLTLLDAESEQRVLSVIDTHFYGKQIKQKAELQRPMQQPSQDDGTTYIQEGKYWIKNGRNAIEEQSNYIITDFVQRNLDKLMRAAMTRRFPILLQGPTSSGKTSMVEYLAKRTGHEFVRINNHEHTDLQEYLGTYVSGRDGKLQFQEGLLVKALREGHWIVLDELNLAPTDVLEALNRLLDDNRELLIPETQEIVRPHPDFMLFATQNPAGLYGGRKVLSRAFRNRFLELHFDDIPISELHIILERRARIPPKWSQFIVNVYKELSMLRQDGKVFEQKGFATLRDLFRWALRPVEDKQQLAEYGFMLLGERCRRADERQEVKAVIERVMSTPGPRVSIDENALYAKLAADLPAGEIVWTRAMKRLYGLTICAIRNNEPVLLVGETGCGKTTVCQVIAQLRKQELSIVNAHQNTETGDLIGAQRPARNRSAVEKKLIDLLQDYPHEQVQTMLATAGLAAALTVLDSLEVQPDAERYALIRDARNQLNVLFEWKDGSLVEAMKKGSLFLLDEISLADDSVLERLNSVLEPHRSMLLAEKGSLDSFVKAADGFQFFATMNPGGDYGKKELSPALRNRFTEIWVPALSDEEDILSVISAKLKDGGFAKPMFDFAVWFQARYDSSASSAVHIRDLLAWAEFMNGIPTGAARHHWFLSGAGMVYVDSIGANPAGMIAITAREIQAELSACIDKLAEIVQTYFGEQLSKDLLLRITTAATTDAETDWFNIASDGNTGVDAPTIRSNTARVVRAMRLHKPVLLEGPPGVGKTTLVTNLAKSFGIPLTRINLSEQTDLMDLFGSDAPSEGAGLGSFVWRDAPFLRAMKKGEWVLLDEMNLASQSVLEGLNACLDHRGEVFIPELNQTFQKSSGFRLFAAQNPHHQGGGRKGLPASFVNRFTVVYASSLTRHDVLALFGISSEEEGPRLPFVVDFVESLTAAIDDRALGDVGGPWEVNLRDINRWMQLADSERDILAGHDFEWFADSMITRRFRTKKDRDAVKANFESRLAAKGHLIYGDNFASRQKRLGTSFALSENHMQVGLGMLARSTSASTRLKRLYESYDIRPHLHTLESVMLCLGQGWPVLLVGASGIGKTTLIERLAETVGANVSVFALNAEIDSMDLVGGYEQHDAMRDVHDLALRLQQLGRKLLIAGFADGQVTGPIAALWRLSSELLSASAAPPAATLVSVKETIASLAIDDELVTSTAVADLSTEIDRLITLQGAASQGQFEWINGTLIQAMQRGDWLILDNANLCSPAALDRLNSLLEPNGELLINEHTDADGQATRVVPHPDFRIILTMDPKHGELSRALRNRCVELCMFPDDTTDSIISYDANLTYHFNSQMSRLSQLRRHLSLEDRQFLDEAYAIEHLSPQDLKFKDILLHENGLFGDSQLMARYINGLYSFRKDRTAANDSSMLDLQAVYLADNSLLATAVANHEGLDVTALEASSRPIDVIREVAPMRLALEGVQYQAGSAMSALQKSAAPGAASGPFPLLAATFNVLQSTIDSLSAPDKWTALGTLAGDSSVHAADADNCTLSALLHQLRLFWWVLYELSGSRETPDIILQILLWRASRDIQAACADLSPYWRELLASNGHLADVSTVWQQASVSKEKFANVDSIDALWNALRPWTPKDAETYAARDDLLRLIGDFDARFWHLPLNIRQAVNLRSSMINVLAVPSADANACIEAQKLIKDVLDQAEVDTELVLEKQPFLQAEFERLVELVDLHRSGNLGSSDHFGANTLGLAYSLSGRPSRAIVETSIESRGGGHSPLTRLSLKLLGSFRATLSDPDDDHLARDFSSATLTKLRKVGLVPIHQIDLLRCELQTMGNVVAANANVFNAGAFGYLQQALSGLVTDVLGLLPDGHGLKSLLAGASDVDADLIGMFAPAIAVTAKRAGNANDARDLAYGWISFFVGCILLYTPQWSYDPALHAQLRWDLHVREGTGLRNELDALKNLEKRLTGEETNYRIRLAEERLAQWDQRGISLRESPVWRSPSWDAEPLQLLLRTLLQSLSPLVTSTGGDVDSLLRTAQDAQLRRSLSSIETRFRSGFEEFKDFTEPLHSFLVSLQIGFDLVDQLAELSSASSSADLIAVPLAGGRPTIVSPQHLPELPGPQAVKYLGLMRKMRPSSSVENNSLALQALLSDCHASWKKRLESEQNKAALKSSMYRYRGDAELEEEVDEAEFDQLFPNSDDSNVTKDATTAQSLDIQRFASDVAIALESYFKSSTIDKNDILDLLDDVSRDRLALRNAAHEQQMLPALIRQLDRHLHGLSNASSAPKGSYNIYTDSNLEQVHRMTSLVANVQSRFKVLRQAWPEHTTLEDVLKTCQELLSFAHTDPLVKILTKLEKLHEQIHEWQTVASKEFSAAQCYDAVVDLIVSWRQLELSTWSRMLDQESVKCQYDAKSWVFLAYESIIAATQDVEIVDENSNMYIIELIKTLESFMKSTGLGQFEARLQIISDLRQVILTQDNVEGSLARQLTDALANFLSYMNSFRAPIREAITKGRASLDKDMKNVIQLASWKDTNILTLKMSAKKSHHKLFKVIRKFRALLGQPVEPIIASGPKRGDTTSQALVSVKSAYPLEADWFASLPDHRSYCEQNVASWASVPARFRNSDATIKLIGNFTKRPETAISSAEEVSIWMTDVLNEAEMLRKATPMNLTVENKAEAQHLKARKRVLFAEVLKQLRVMGFKSNSGTDLLAKQASFAIVLATSNDVNDVPALRRAEADIHDLLHNMPQVRMAAREHSEDLTGAEVGRSVALLESMLHDLLAQRSQATTHARASESFSQLFSMARNLASAKNLSVMGLSAVSDSEGLQDAMVATSSILAAAVEIMQAQFRLANQGGVAQVNTLSGLVTALQELVEQRTTSLNLPDRLTDSNLIQLDATGAHVLAKVQSNIDAMTEENPALQPLLSQIKLWCTTTPSITTGLHPSSTLEEAQQAILSLVDHMLGCVQTMPRILENLPVNSEDALWLVKEVSTTQHALEAFGMATSTARLSHVLSLLPIMSANECQAAVSLLLTVTSIIAQYADAHDKILDRYIALYSSLATVSAKLAKMFVNLSRDGFCSPKEKEGESSSNDSKVEAGTGLGDGEGAEDISKDIGDDEDLTELAQEKNENPNDDQVEDEKDAVDMADQDLEGEMGDAEPKDEEGEESGDEEDKEDIEEEAGSVDDLGENTVDEKMWDQGGEMDADKDQTADQAEGTKDKDEMAAGAEEDKKKEKEKPEPENTDEDGQGDEAEAEEQMQGEDEDENGPPQEAERADPTMDQEDNLDLPDDIDMDGKDDDDKLDDDLDMMDDGQEDEAPLPDGEVTADEPPVDDSDELPEQEPDVIDDTMGEDQPDDNEGEDINEAGEDAMDDEQGENAEEEQAPLQDNRPDDSTAAEQVAPSEAQGTGLDQEQQDDPDNKATAGASERPQGAEGDTKDMQQASGESGERGDADNDDNDATQNMPDDAQQAQEKFKKLGDALEKWYKSQQEIHDSREREEDSDKPEPQRTEQKDAEMKDAEFEHLKDEDDEADAQALGAAREDEAKAIDDAGTGVNEEERRDQFDQTEQPEVEDQDVDMTSTDIQKPEEQSEPQEAEEAKAFVGERAADRIEELTEDAPTPMSVDSDFDEEEEAAISALDQRLRSTDLGLAAPLTTSEAHSIWATHESRTRTLSLQLQEQLRLILAPTQSSKLRGDFRTGKRLNIKRIIPYIASGYKRDKIWLRRSVPSKRQYQILLALDDSHSMAEGGIVDMAFDTLALVSKALSMLEAGELAVLGFGAEVRCPVGFGAAWAPEAGADVVRQLRFDQAGTDVKGLLQRAQSMFEDAAVRRSGPSEGAVWQLMLVVGDGVFQDAEGVRVAERALREMRIMVVFVIVDACGQAGKKQSITELQTATFSKGPDGQTTLVTKKYLETFPFRYYLIVRDVVELPGVLASALRQWFAEVAESS